MFTYHIPTKVYFGKGQLENLENVAKSYGKKFFWFMAAVQ